MSADKGSVQSDTLAALKAEANQLHKKIREERRKLNDADLFQIGEKVNEITSGSLQVRSRRILKGHTGKVLDVDWSLDKRKIVSSSQDGKLIVFDAFANSKDQCISMPVTWINTCAYSPSGNFIACGGLDNKCTVFPTDFTSSQPSIVGGGKQQSSVGSETTSGKMMPKRKVAAYHTSYVSACSFTHSDHQILTASGDSTCMLWDVQSCTMLQTFHGHQCDVLDAALNPLQTCNLFVSGGADRSARTWDMRISKCVHSFHSNTSDINVVRWFPTGEAFATGSDDGTIRLFDLRADREVAIYEKNSVLFAVNDLDFTLSGRIIFGAYNDYLVHAWDTIKGTKLAAVFGHDNRVSALRMSPDGTAFCTGSWDATVRVWA